MGLGGESYLCSLPTFGFRCCRRLATRYFRCVICAPAMPGPASPDVHGRLSAAFGRTTSFVRVGEDFGAIRGNFLLLQAGLSAPKPLAPFSGKPGLVPEVFLMGARAEVVRSRLRLNGCFRPVQCRAGIQR